MTNTMEKTLAPTPSSASAAPAQPALRRAVLEPGAAVFVGGTWVAMLLFALAFVARYGSNVPLWDDWFMVPAMTGEEPDIPGWLWSQYGEHRIVLPKLILLALAKLTGGDFRAGMFWNVGTVAALALALIVAARRLRGWVSYTDAFFPLVLLNLGHYLNFLTSWQVNQVVPPAVTGLLLCVMVSRPTPLAPGSAVVAGLSLALLVLCGAMGVVFVPPVALWLAYLGYLHGRSGAPLGRRRCLLVNGVALAALVLVAVYFWGYERNASRLAGLWAAAIAAAQFGSISLGPAGAAWWPWSGWGVALLGLVSTVLLLAAWWRQPRERARTSGLLVFLAAMTALALAIGLGRAEVDYLGRAVPNPNAGLELRYVTMAVGLLCGVYFVWTLYGPSAGRRLLPMALFALACAAVPLNVQEALKAARDWRQRIQAFECDLRAGAPAWLLAERHSAFLYPWSKEDMAANLRRLHHAAIGPFALLQDGPAFREVPVPFDPIVSEQMEWSGGVGYGRGNDSRLLFALGEAQWVYAVRLRFSYGDAASPHALQVFWRREGEESFTPAELGPPWPPVSFPEQTEPEEKTLLLWVNAKIAQIRLRPDNRPCVFKLLEIVLLVPDANR